MHKRQEMNITTVHYLGIKTVESSQNTSRLLMPAMKFRCKHDYLFRSALFAVVRETNEKSFANAFSERRDFLRNFRNHTVMSLEIHWRVVNCKRKFYVTRSANYPQTTQHWKVLSETKSLQPSFRVNHERSLERSPQNECALQFIISLGVVWFPHSRRRQLRRVIVGERSASGNIFVDTNLTNIKSSSVL